MNIVIIPFHDWRKIIKEGFRTRDAHFIEVLNRKENIRKIIINRPITFLEIFVKRKKRNIKGEIVYQQGKFKMYKIQKNTYLIDFVSKSTINQILQKYKWYINSYGEKHFVAFINESLSILKVKDYCLLSQNVFSYKLAEKLNPKIQIFDAWDNFTKFKVYQPILDEIENGYKTFAKCSNLWITNARENLDFFKKRFQPKSIQLISNGVDLERFVHNKETKIPDDLAKVKKPIIGFGGKITQLLDTNLINNIVQNTPDVSFVFVGQLLDKNVFNKIVKHPNFHYLGDKHYDEYPNYVKNFDICIVPYVTGEEQKSGANSIKVYEYLATGKKVVGTFGNGLEDLKENLYLVKTAALFSKELQHLKNNKDQIDLAYHSWENKVNSLIELIENETGS